MEHGSAIERAALEVRGECKYDNLSGWVTEHLVPALERLGLSVQRIVEEARPDEAPKPCPFCGGIKVKGAISKDDTGTVLLRMLCWDCGATGPAIRASNLLGDATLPGWNKRVMEP